MYLGNSYSEALVANPILVKSITSGVLAALGNFLAQRMAMTAAAKVGDANAEKPKLNIRSIAAFGIFGLGITGPATHFFLNWLDRHGPAHPMFKLFIDRFLWGPVFLIISLYALSRLEGSSHESAFTQAKKVYWSALKMMWKVWIIVQYVNLNFVPLQYRVLVANVVSVGWNIILSRKRLAQEKKKQREE
jgi:peroxisomal membrane protein 2